MDKNELKQFVENGLSQREIAEQFNVSQATIRWWLNKYDLKTKYHKFCRYCGKIKTKSCTNHKFTYRWKRLKKEAVEYLGGKCSICGYNKCYNALEFHHRNPNKKLGTWTDMKKWSKSRRLIELDKCILLCSNCHKEIHEIDN